MSRPPHRSLVLRLGACLVASLLSTGSLLAQPAGESAVQGAVQSAAPAPAADSRAGVLAAEQAAKAQDLHPYAPNRAEALLDFVEAQLMGGGVSWHAFFDSAYQGGGFTLGGGYLKHVGSYNTLDMRGSITFSNYKRLETEFRAPRLFNRRGVLSVIGGWREATQVGFFGTGTANTSQDDRVNYGFQQPYATARLDVRPTRKLLVLGTGIEYSRWNTQEGAGGFPSIEEVYTPESLPGLGASPTYLQVLGSAALDSRDAAGYSRRGGYYGVTARNFSDTDDVYSFRQVDYEAIHHIPIRRDAWILSLRGRVETTYTDDGVEVPFFMLPSLGGGSTLRGFQSWRFRDRHSLLISAEWRVLVNRFIDTAVFYDAGKVTRRIADLDLNGLKENYGIGLRIHGPAATPLRIDIARGNEGLRVVFAASSSF